MGVEIFQDFGPNTDSLTGSEILPLQIGLRPAAGVKYRYNTLNQLATYIRSGGGSGTVTSVSVVTANGISGTVDNPTTTPAITLALGAITPSSVAATGLVSGSNLSGSNSGDVTIGTGNGLSLAGQALSLALASTLVFGAVKVDGTTIVSTGGVISAISNGSVQSVTGLNTDNADPANPIVKISVDGTTITGLGTPGSPLIAHAPADAVTSVNGQVGVVVLTTANINDSTDRRYVTDAQLVVIGNTSGTNSGNVTIGTGNGLSLAGQAISLALASTSVTGALSSADWNTFNGKQPAGSYVLQSTTVNGHALSANVTVTASDVGLGSVTNDAQTKAAIVPNTTPSAGQVLAGNAGGTAYAPVSVSGDGTLSSAGALIVTKTNGVAFAASATTNTTTTANITDSTNKRFVTDAQLVVIGNTSGTNSGDISLVAVGAVPSANGASLSGQVLTLQPADGTHPGLLTSGAQTIGGAKTFNGAITASNLSGTNTGDQIVPVNTTATTSQYFTAYNSATGAFTKAQPAFSDISGTAAAAQLPLATTGAFGAVKPDGTTITISAGVISAVAGGAGTVTTTGTPASGNLSKFSGATSITNGDLSGDVTTSGTLAATLATVNANTGSFGSSTAIPNFTVNGKGLITAAGTNVVIAPAGTLTGTTLNATVVTSSLTTVGTIGTGVWNGTTIDATHGGTAQTSYALGDILYSSATNTLSKLAGNTAATKQFLSQTGNGTISAAPAWGLLVSGDIPNNAANTTGSAAKWTTARNLAGNSVDGSANVAFANKFIVQGTADAGLSAAQFLGALGTGIVKNTTTTGVLSIAIAADFPTLNQSTTGSAATLTTPRSIYGNNFDGSAALAQIIGSAFGGTNNGFFAVSGPATSTKTFTFPNANAAVLTDNAAVTVAQGGTGLATLTSHAVLIGAGTSNVAFATVGTAGRVLIDQGAAADPSFNAVSGDGTLSNAGALVITKTNGVAFAASATTDATNATNISSGSLALGRIAAIGTNTILSNITGGSAVPVANTLTALIDTISATQGVILYRNATAWVALAVGSSGQLLSSGGPAANPLWITASGTGTVTNVATDATLTGGPITTTGTLGIDLNHANTWVGIQTFTTPVLGTPGSGTLTNCTGLPVATGISGLGTGVATFLATPSSANLVAAVTGETGTGALVFGTSPTFTTSIILNGTSSGTQTLQAGAAASGVLTLPIATDTLVGLATTDTLTNKRVTKRAPAVTQSATPTINTDITDVAHITGLAQAITSMTTNLSGTPVQGDTLRIDITDNGTARAITWGASFEASTVALPTTTVINTRLDIGFFWNTVTSKWRCVAVA